MAREKINLSVQKHGDKIRYRKMYKGNMFRSSVYSNNTRENRQEARQKFVDWRQQFSTVEDRKKAVHDEAFQLATNNIVEMMKAYKDEKKRTKVTDFTASILNNIDHPNFSLKDAEQKIERHNQNNNINTNLHLKSLIDVFLNEEMDRTTIDKKNKRSLSLSAYKKKVSHLNDFLTLLGNIHIDEITEQEVKRVFESIDKRTSKNQPISEATKLSRWVSFKEFVKWTTDENHRTAPSPRNFRSKKLMFAAPEFTPKPPTIADALYVLEKLRENNRPLLELSVWLHLNCGMYSSDIASITQSL